MKLTLQREQLLKPLQMVIGVVDHKQAMPILSNVLLHVNEKKLSITGTDLEVELVGQSTLQHSDTEDKRLTLSARKLLDICRALPENASIELHQDKNRVVVTSNRSRFTMSTLSPDDFPCIEPESSEANVNFTISQQELYTLLRRTAFAMAEQDVRYYLNGMLLEITDNQLRLVATDGHRLALNQTIIHASQPNRTQVIVPYRAIMELTRLVKDVDTLLSVHVGHQHIRITCDDFIFTSKLVEGRFPDYQRVIPKMGDKVIIANSDALRAALLRTAILCHDKVRGVHMDIHPGTLKLNAHNPEQEIAEEELDVDYRGEILTVAFNITYILDVLNVINTSDVQLTFVDAKNGMRIDEPGNENQSVFVVMPMQL